MPSKRALRTATVIFAMSISYDASALAQAARTASRVPIAADTIPHWTGQFSYSDTVYEYTMVGTDPHRGSATTVIPTVLIPVRFEISDGTVYDASASSFDGITAAQGISRSPIFKPYDFSVDGISLGRTQYADAYQRANFWTDVSARAPDYHVLLGQPTVLPTLTVTASADQLYVYHDDSGLPDLPILNGVPLTPVTSFLKANVPPGTLAIFVTGLVQWGGKGLHNASKNAQGDASQTYIVTSYYPSAYGDMADIWPLSHEILEWLNDPFAGNLTPGWNLPGYPLQVCGSSTFGDLLETGDPFDLSGPVHTLTDAVRTYHLQDAMFLDFFTRAPQSRSVSGAYSFFHDATGPTSSCVGHLPLMDTRTFFYPGSVSTTGSGINNLGDIVGYYEDSAKHYHGFILSNGHMQRRDAPGATDSFALQINDAAMTVGYFSDTDGNLHGYSEREGAFQILDYPGSFGTYAQGVNNRGDIVGGYYDANYATHGFVLRRGQYSTLDSTLGPLTELTGINDRETKTGIASDWSGNVVGGFAEARGAFVPIAVPNALQTIPLDLNNQGEVVGFDYEARVCPCTFGAVGFLATETSTGQRYRYLVGLPRGINDRGQIVGAQFDGRGFVASIPPSRDHQ